MELDSYAYTVWVDTKIAKQMMQQSNAFELREKSSTTVADCSSCGSKNVEVRAIYYGRLRGVQCCSGCVQREKRWLDELLAFDESKLPERKRTQENAKPKPVKRAKMKVVITKEEQRRTALEEAGQQRLF